MEKIHRYGDKPYTCTNCSASIKSGSDYYVDSDLKDTRVFCLDCAFVPQIDYRIIWI
jgi:hypothetical protein